MTKRTLLFLSFIVSTNAYANMQDTWRAYIFKEVYRTNNWDYLHQVPSWRDAETKSGASATPEQTIVIRKELPRLLKALDVKSIIDAGCGDWCANFCWVRDSDLSFLTRYIGVDIVADITSANHRAHSDAQHVFIAADAVTAPLPTVDLILCRDVMVYVPHEDVFRFLVNCKNSGSKYLLMTSYEWPRPNWDLNPRFFRPLNMQRPPFNFPKPLAVIKEYNTQSAGDLDDKCLMLWRIEDLPSFQ